MPRPFRQFGSCFAGLKHYFLAALAVISLSYVPSASPAYEGPTLTPQLVLIVDESGSMQGRHAWLLEVLPTLGQELIKRNKYVFPDNVKFTVAGFTNQIRILIQEGSDIDAARAVSYLRTVGGIEDGYVAIRNVLNRHPEYEDTPTTVILVSDEDRDVTDSDISLASLADYLTMKGVVVHVVVPAQIFCPDRKAGLAVDMYRVALHPGFDGLSTCAGAMTRTYQEYAELAWATGGLVWDLDLVAPGWRKRASLKVLEHFVGGLADRILMQWPTGPLWADIEIWPTTPRRDDVVYFDGSKSFTNQPGRQVSHWAWDLDGDGTVDTYGPTVAGIFATSGRHRIVLEVTDDSNPPTTSRKVLHMEVAD